MNILPQTTTIFTVSLNEDEINAILVDPSDFQNELRVARNLVLAPRQKRQSVSLPRTSAPKAKAADGRSHPGRTAAGRKPCPKCERMLSPQGMARHLPTCTGERPQG